MVDIIDEEIELHLVDTSQLVAEAKKLKEAQRIKKQNDKIQRQLTTSTAPISFIGEKDILPKREAKIQTRKGAITGQKTTSAFTDMQKKIKELEKKQKNNLKKIDEFQDKIADELGNAKNLLSPIDAVQGVGIIHNTLGRFGPIGAAIAAVVGVMIFELSEQFKRGGIFSTALPITEREKNIVDIDYVVDVRSGIKFLTSDLRLAQKAPETSNTLNLRYEHIRYTSQELGK